LGKKATLQFHISIDPRTHPNEFEIALILKRQKSFNKMFREFLREYAIAVAEQVKQETPTAIHQ
jgi:hypothetical protein